MNAQRLQSRKSSHTLPSVACRCWWGTLCFIHMAPLISTTTALSRSDQPASSALSCALVWLTFAFFALKFIDVPWLRWHISGSSVLAFVVACGVTHKDISPSQGAEAFLAEVPAAIAISLIGKSFRRTARAIPGILTKIARQLQCQVRLWLASCDSYLIAMAGPAHQRSMASIAIPRGPPVR
jgi:hypothetical protein